MGYYNGDSSSLVLVEQVLDEKCSVGKKLRDSDLLVLRSKFNDPNNINVILTADDVAVDGFCMTRCSMHGSTKPKNVKPPTPYIWVGNTDSQCPDRCNEPFHTYVSEVTMPGVKPPNGDYGVDAMIVPLAAQLVGTVTGDGAK